jgi:hypothetical protein
LGPIRPKRLGKRLDRDPDEEQRVVVAGDPVRRERAAALAAMNEDPLAVLANGDRDRLHRGLAVGRAVAPVVVEVTRPEAVGAMVAVGGAGRGERDVEPAMDAAEGLGAAVEAALTLGSGQLDSFSGNAGKPSVKRRHAPGHGTTVPVGTVSGLSDGAGLRAGGPPEA